jgi:branched-chain amino acid aminotransferase
VERKYIDEVGAMNIAFVLNGKEIVTPSLTGAILHGITRRSLLELAPDLGYDITERRIEIKEIIDGLKDGSVTEIFGMGTGAVIAPVGRISYKDQPIVIKDGQPGPVATHLYNELTDIQYGRKIDPYHWTQTVSVAS